jgi:hypothetical protein
MAVSACRSRQARRGHATDTGTCEHEPDLPVPVVLASGSRPQPCPGWVGAYGRSTLGVSVLVLLGKRIKESREREAGKLSTAPFSLEYNAPKAFPRGPTFKSKDAHGRLLRRRNASEFVPPLICCFRLLPVLVSFSINKMTH